VAEIVQPQPVQPGHLAKISEPTVDVLGSIGVPIVEATTRSRSCHDSPAASLSRACRERCARSAWTASAGSVTGRVERCVSGATKRSAPSMRWTARRTNSAPPSRSTSAHRRPSSSPRRSPVVSARTKTASSRSPPSRSAGSVPRPGSLARLATADATVGELERACVIGLRVVQIGHATGSARIARELLQLRRRLAPWRERDNVSGPTVAIGSLAGGSR
jgi:hypothetical protein